MASEAGMTRTDKKLIIFDCDGVLFDSRKANIAYFERCLEIAGEGPLTEDMHSLVHYLSIRQLAERITGGDEVRAEKIIKASAGLDYTPFIPLLSPFFSFDGLLLPLRSTRYLAVASNRSGSLTSLFHHFDLFSYFHFKVSTLDTRPKPHPDMLYRCIDYFACKPENTHFIGDSITDEEAAAAASVGFSYYRGSGEDEMKLILDGIR